VIRIAEAILANFELPPLANDDDEDEDEEGDDGDNDNGIMYDIESLIPSC
jgi:hypothetical protein